MSNTSKADRQRQREAKRYAGAGILESRGRSNASEET
jgi:hypothetical protein